MTPLELALESRNAPAIQMLLDKGAMVDRKLTYHERPVFCACAWGWMAGVRLLVEGGADIRARASNGLTCLLVAANNKHFAVVSYLLHVPDCGINDSDKNGDSALHYASAHDHAITIAELVQNGATINARNTVSRLWFRAS